MHGKYKQSRIRQLDLATPATYFLRSYRVLIKYCVFLQKLQLLPRQHSAAIVCTKMTSQQERLYTRIASRALKVSYSDVGEGGVAVNCEKTQFFLNTLYIKSFGTEIRLHVYIFLQARISHCFALLLTLFENAWQQELHKIRWGGVETQVCS